MSGRSLRSRLNHMDFQSLTAGQRRRLWPPERRHHVRHPALDGFRESDVSSTDPDSVVMRPGARPMRVIKYFLCASVLLTILGTRAPVAADTYQALVVKIVDGDTLDVFHDGHKERVRLKDVDCPELGQAYGRRARRFTGELSFNQMVTVTTHGKDATGRTLADIALPEIGRAHV